MAKGKNRSKSKSPREKKQAALDAAQEKADALKQSNMKDNITAEGKLTTQENSSNVKIVGFSVNYHGVELVDDADLSLTTGARYGLVGATGSGKSATLTAIGQRMIPIPEQLTIYHLDQEVAPSDTTAREAVLEDLEELVNELEEEYEELCMDDPEDPRIDYLCEMLDELDPEMATVRASKILHGLGFTSEMQDQACKDFSGGWRMRVSLAKALFTSPSLLVCDEPTAHLDLSSTVWLEHYLQNTFKGTLLLVSHSQDFLNGVCNNIIHLNDQTLTYYGGNYDSFVQTRKELEENQSKKYKWEQDRIADMKDYIARFGHGSAKLAKQAQSKEKALARMQERGLTKKVTTGKSLKLHFPSCGPLPPPVVGFDDVTFGYSPDKVLYSNVSFGIDLDSKICIVGPNGAGKSSLMNLMLGKLEPLDGQISTHSHLRWGHYHQHLGESMDASLSPLEYMEQQYPKMTMEELRSQVGRFGVTGDLQTRAMYKLSDGQRARVVFAWLAAQKPHILALDEPTNCLSIEMIDSLAAALNEFEGGCVIISHDFRLIDQVADQIWEVDGAVIPWKGSIIDYKKKIAKEIEEFM